MPSLIRSACLGRPGAEITVDNRYEHFVQCNTDWEDDGLSIMNLCWVFNDMLKMGADLHG
jgi:hypothetical protein